MDWTHSKNAGLTAPPPKNLTTSRGFKEELTRLLYWQYLAADTHTDHMLVSPHGFQAALGQALAIAARRFHQALTRFQSRQDVPGSKD